MYQVFRAIPRGRASALLIGLCGVVGCAQVRPTEDYRAAARRVAEATDESAVFAPDDEAAGTAKIDELMREGLGLKEAVQIALLNNPELQASFFRLGMSRADVVQSGLFSNPTLAFSAQFPEGGGRSNIQASLAQNIVDLWQIPIRKRVARAQLEEAILRLAQQAALLAAETKKAYFAALGTQQAAAIAESNLRVAVELRDGTLARRSAGTVGELDVNLARGTALGAEVELQSARLDSAGARRRLATLLGLTVRAEELTLVDPLPEAAEIAVSDETLVALALDVRLDLQAADRSVEAHERRIAEQYAKVFPDLSVGPFLERGERRAQPGRDILADTARASLRAGQLTAPDIQTRAQRDQERRQEINALLGPAMTMTLPIFDQNQAQIAKAKLGYDAAVRERIALQKSIIQEARQALDQAATAARLARFYDVDILPQSQKNLDLSNKAYRAGTTSIITVLDAQRTLLATRRLAVSARQSAAIALADLERVVGRPVADIVRHGATGPKPIVPGGATTRPAAMEAFE